MNHRAGFPLQDVSTDFEPSLGVQADTRLVLEIDDQTWLDQAFRPQGAALRSKIFEDCYLSPGEYQIKLVMLDQGRSVWLLKLMLDETVTLSPGQI